MYPFTLVRQQICGKECKTTTNWDVHCFMGEFYGSEKCSTLLASLRRIFIILGEIVASLKLYINMA